jgi:hypothetical protein
MTHLSKRCPIGFAFRWNGDCPSEPLKRYTFTGRLDNSTIPQFLREDHEHARWSPRLEEVAQESYMASLSNPVQARAAESALS